MSEPEYAPKRTKTHADWARLSLDLLELIAAAAGRLAGEMLAGVRTTGRLRRVCRSWKDLGFYAVTRDNPKTVIIALGRAPADYLDRLAVAGLFGSVPADETLRGQILLALVQNNSRHLIEIGFRENFFPARFSTRDLAILVRVAVVRVRQRVFYQQLLLRYAPTSEAIRADDNYILRVLAQLNCPCMLRWLADTYRLGPADARAGNNFAIYEAAKNGFAEVLEVLADVYLLTAADARENQNTTLCAAVEAGHDNAVEVLADKYHLSNQDAFRVFKTAVQHHRIKCLTLFAEKFALTPEDVKYEILEALKYADNVGDKELYRVLNKHYYDSKSPPFCDPWIVVRGWR